MKPILFQFILTCLLLAACAPPLEPAPLATPAQPALAEPAQAIPPPSAVEATATPGIAWAETSPAPDIHTTPALSLDEIQALIIADLTARRGVNPAEARIDSAETRRWPNAGLGCHTRPGVFEPLPTAGYLIRIEAAGQSFEYHTDMYGSFVFCPTLTKPIDPIR